MTEGGRKRELEETERMDEKDEGKRRYKSKGQKREEEE